MRRNLLIWAEDVSKLLKEYEGYSAPKNIQLYIMGDSLRMEEIKLLDNWKQQGMDIHMDQAFTGPDSSANKQNMEMFVLGRCFEQLQTGDVEMLCFHVPNKNTTEQGKRLNISVSKFGDIENKKKSSKSKSATSAQKRNQKTEIQNTEKTLAETNAPKTRISKTAQKGDITETIKPQKNERNSSPLKKLEGIVKNSNLTEKEKKIVADKGIQELADIIKQASDASIGLPMLLELHMYDKTIAKKLGVAIQPEFKTLKEEL